MRNSSADTIGIHEELVVAGETDDAFLEYVSCITSDHDKISQISLLISPHCTCPGLLLCRIPTV